VLQLDGSSTSATISALPGLSHIAVFDVTTERMRSRQCADIGRVRRVMLHVCVAKSSTVQEAEAEPSENDRLGSRQSRLPAAQRYRRLSSLGQTCLVSP
jgi:hypothetical protein